MIMTLLYGYLAVMNVLTYIVYGVDKHKSRKKGVQRIPEKTLIGLALLGGSAGALSGMYAFWHKIRKPKFYIGIPCILLFHLGIAILIYCLCR